MFLIFLFFFSALCVNVWDSVDRSTVKHVVRNGRAFRTGVVKGRATRIFEEDSIRVVRDDTPPVGCSDVADSCSAGPGSFTFVGANSTVNARVFAQPFVAFKSQIWFDTV